MYIKNFDAWNNLKKKINYRTTAPFANRRDIWWCSVGVNIGTEEDGKHELFERPVLIVKIFNKNTVSILPFTSSPHASKYHIPILYRQQKNFALISQVKTISTLRLSRKIGRIDVQQFQTVINAIKAML